MAMLSVVTGGTSGIGREVAHMLVRQGHRVVIAGRNAAEGARLAALYPGRLTFERANLSLLSEVHRLSSVIIGMGQPVDLLVHCAGLHAQSRLRTRENIELNLAINYLAKYALTRDLLPTLAAAPQGRIVVVGSPYVFDPAWFLKPDRLNAPPLPPAFWSLVLSGMAVSVWAVEMARRLKDTRVTINTIVPGIVDTNILRGSSTLVRLMDRAMRPFVGLSVRQGAAGPLALAIDPAMAGISGRFFRNTAKRGPKPIDVPRGTYDTGLAARLMEFSEHVDGLGIGAAMSLMPSGPALCADQAMILHAAASPRHVCARDGRPRHAGQRGR